MMMNELDNNIKKKLFYQIWGSLFSKQNQMFYDLISNQYKNIFSGDGL